jgi:hypothetical protein
MYNMPLILTEITEAMNTPLMRLFGITRSFKKAVTFSDSITTIQLMAKPNAPPRKMVTDIHSSITLLKGLQKDTKFQWGYHSVVVLLVMKKQITQP